MKSKLPSRVCLGSLLLAVALSNQAREITDMAGRKVTIPDKITKVYAAQPYTNVLMYIVAPDLMVGLLSPPREESKRFVRPEAAALPVLGTAPGGAGAGTPPGGGGTGAQAGELATGTLPGARGGRSQVNLEAVLALKPDFALAKGGPNTNVTRTEEQFAKISLPVVFVDIDRIADYPAGIEFVGKLLGREERALKLSAYATRILTDVEKVVAAIPPEKRVRVYYAESADGLATESDKSFHADAIRLAGGS